MSSSNTELGRDPGTDVTGSVPIITGTIALAHHDHLEVWNGRRRSTGVVPSHRRGGRVARSPQHRRLEANTLRCTEGGIPESGRRVEDSAAVAVPRRRFSFPSSRATDEEKRPTSVVADAVGLIRRNGGRDVYDPRSGYQGSSASAVRTTSSLSEL